MKKKKILQFILALSLLILMSGCVLENSQPVTTDSPENVTFTFNVKVIGTRANDNLPAEIISSLRVIMVSIGENGNESLEKNELISNVVVNEDNMLTVRLPQVTPGQKKRLYLLANCENPYLQIKAEGNELSLTDEMTFISDNDGEVFLEKATFIAPKGSYEKNNLAESEGLVTPYTALHKIYLPELAEMKPEYVSKIGENINYTFPERLLLVRAMNKITFEFYNNSGIDLNVTGFSLYDVNANGMTYLLAALDDGISNPVYASFENSGDDVNPAWMKWLAAEADKTNPDGIITGNEWLSNYKMPEEENSVFSFSKTDKEIPESVSDGIFLENGSVTFTSPVYFPETKYITSGGKQEYEISFKVWSKESESASWESVEEFTDEKRTLANLQSLFRNTHVVIKVYFTELPDKSLDMDVDVDHDPYDDVELNPEFGLASWDATTDRDPYDETELNPEFGLQE